MLKEGVTDASLQAMAEEGCGKNLKYLNLMCECCFFCFFAFLRLSSSLPSLLCPNHTPSLFRCPTTGNMSVTDNNFAASLGLPKEFRGKLPEEAHREWQLRRDQHLFLRERANKTTAVFLWDEQHEFSLILFLSLSLSIIL